MADINRFSSVTPMMRRYFEIKQKFPDALVFYRLGDFFELFYDDAKVVSSLLDLTLTRRNSNSDDPIPMAGVPYQSADGYIAKLIKQGRSVVLCDQVGEKSAKGMMERKVTRIITPGTVTDENMLSDNEDNIIACVFEEQGVLGLSTLSISSGRYTASEFNSFAGLSLMLSKLNPAELLYPERFKFYQGIQGIICRKALPLWEFSYDTCYASLCKQFRTRSLNGFGIEKLHAGVCAAGALLCYVKNTQSTPIEHVRSICLEDYSSFVVIDKTARKNLELTETLSGDHDASLFDIIDKTSTPMGSRQLRSMLVNPLRNNAEVERRLDLVESLQHTSHSVELMALLQAMGDLERIVARIGLRKAQPRDLSTLRDAIKLLPQLKSLLRAGTSQDIPPVAINSARTSRCEQGQATTDSAAAPSAEAVTATATATTHAHESPSAEHTTANGVESSAADAEHSAANAMSAAASTANAESTSASANSSEVASSASAAAIGSQSMAVTCSEGCPAVSDEGSSATNSSATTSTVSAVAQSDARFNTSTTSTNAIAPSAGAGADMHAAAGGDMRNAVDREAHGGIGTSSKAAVGNDTYATVIGHVIQATVGMDAVDSAAADISVLSSSTVVRTTGDAIFVTDAAVSAVEALASGNADASASASSAASATASSGALAASSSHSDADEGRLTLSTATRPMSASGTAVESTATTMQARSIAPNGLSSVAAVATGNTMANAMEATAAKAIDNASHVSASDAMSIASATHSAKAAYHAMDESSSDWAKDLIVSSAATYALSGTIAQLKPSHAASKATASGHAAASTTAPTTTMAASTAASVAAASSATAATDVARNAASDTANAATEAKGLSTTSSAGDGAKAEAETKAEADAEANHLTHHSTGKAGAASSKGAAAELEASSSQTSKSYTAANTTMAKGMTVDSRANTDKETKHYADDDANWNASVRIYDHSDVDSTQSGNVRYDSHSNRLCDSNHYQSGAVSHPLGNATDAAEPASTATAATASASAPASEASAFASALAPTATTKKLGYSNKDLLHATTSALASRNADEDDSEIITEIELAQMHRAFEHACNSSLAFSSNKRERAFSSLLSPESIDKVNKAFSANCGSPVLATVMVPPLKKRTSKSDSSKQDASSSSIASSTSSSSSGSGSGSDTDAQSSSNALVGHKAETESNSCSSYSYSSGSGSGSGSGKTSTALSTDTSVADSSISVASGAMATTASSVAEHAQSSAPDTNTSTDAVDAEHVASGANTAMTAEDAQAVDCTSVDKASSQAMAEAVSRADANAVANAHDLSVATAASDNHAKGASAADVAGAASVSEEGIGAGIDADTGTDADAYTGSDANAFTDVDADEATDVGAVKAKDLAGGHTTCTSNCSLSECISGDDNADMSNEHETSSSSTAATATDVGDKDKSEGSLKCSVSTHAKAAGTGTASGTDTARISKGSTTSVTDTANGSATGKKHSATHSKATTAKSHANGLSKDAVAVASGDCSSSADGSVSGKGSCSAKSTVGSKKKATRSKSKARVSKANAVAPTRASITATDTHGEDMPTEHARVHDESDAHQLDSNGATESVKRSSRGGHKKRSNKDKHSESESNSSKSTANTACSENSATCGSQAQSSSAMSTEDKSIVSQALNSDESLELGANDADYIHDENESSAALHKNQAMGLDEHEASEHMDGDAISDKDSKTEVVADMDSFDYDDEELDPSAVIEAIAQAAEKLIEAEDELAETAEEDALEQVENLHPITIDGERALRASEIEALENAHEEEALARARARAGAATAASTSTSSSMAMSSSATDTASAQSSASARASARISERESTVSSVKDSTRVTTDTDAASTSDSNATASTGVAVDEAAATNKAASTGVAVDEAAATNKAAASGADIDSASASSDIAQMDATATAQGTDSLAAASQADKYSDAVSTTNTVATHAASHGSSSDETQDGDITTHSSATADVSAVEDVTAVCDVSASVDDTMDTDDAGEARSCSKSISSTGVAHSQSMGADGTHNQSNAADVAVAQSNGSDAVYVHSTDKSKATCSGSSNSTSAGKSGTAGTGNSDSSNNGPASGSDTCTSADANTVAEARADSGSKSRTGMDSEGGAVSGGNSCNSSYSGESSGDCSSSGCGLSDAEANSSCSGLSDAEANTGGMGKFDTVLKQRAEMLPDLDDVLDLLLKSINETPSATLREGDVIANGYSKELDELRDLQSGSENTLLKIEAREKMRTGINSLKVRFNSIHGYYIEVSKAYSDKVPADYIRRQTLKNTERYITEELKELEDKTISAKTRALQLEKQIYDMLIEELIKYLPDLSCFAHNIALLDSSFALAKTAKAHHFVRPQLSDENIIKIVNGRHPVVEAIADRPFVANSIELRDGHNLAVISGPNMGGKSTFMRQVALISILARMGSFVPAQSAVIGDIDRIFTRIGASDDLASGRSTFMVEMEETATILNNATEHSLVIMDEVGRGTSGAEGAAIAEAIVQYLAKSIHPKTLFATHYTEVTTLVEIYPNAFNLCFNALNVDDNIVFLYQAQEGRQDRSFGIEVAKLAGIPANITKNAIGFYIARSKDLASTALSSTTSYALLSNGHTQTNASRGSMDLPSIAAATSTGDASSASAEMATAAAETTTAEMATDATAVCADANATAANGAGAAVGDGAIQSSSATYSHVAIDTMDLASQAGAGADARAGTDVGAGDHDLTDAVTTAIAQDDAAEGSSAGGDELDEAIALYGNIMSESVAQISQRLVTTQAHLIESKAQKETLEIELSKTQELMNFIKGIELENLSPIDAVALLGTLRERAYAV